MPITIITVGISLIHSGIFSMSSMMPGCILTELAEEFLDAGACKHFLEREAREDRACGKDADRDQHPQRRLMRGLVMLLVVRLAEEGLEHQPPGIERGQPRRDHGHQEAVERQRIMRGVRGFDDRIL